MSHVFYFVGLIIFLMNLNFLMNFMDFLKIKEWFESFQRVTKKIPTSKDFKKGELDKLKKYNASISLNLVWIFIGLISSNWEMFTILLIIHLIFEWMIKLIGEFKTISKFLFFLRLSISTILIFVLVMNHFHWNLNLFHFFWSLTG